jgi:hypothetical protein
MKRNLIVLAGALAIATFATVAVADRPGGGTPPGGQDDDNYPPSCNSAAQVKKIVCPATIVYNETTSASVPGGGPPWSPTTTSKTAAFASAAVGGVANKSVSCLYTADGTDRLSVVLASPKACAMSKKFRGANCCN